MSKSAPLLIALLTTGLLATPLQAQWSVELRGGVNLGDLRIEADTGDEPVDLRTGILAGAIVSYQTDPHLRMRIGGLFSQKGGTQHQADGYEARVRLAYAEIPLGVQFFPTENERFQPFLAAGGFVAFETDCQLQAVGGGQTIDLSCSAEAADRKTTDLGLSLGAGAEIDLGAVVLAGEAGYAFGFRDISHTSSATVNTRTISLSLGLRYVFAGR